MMEELKHRLEALAKKITLKEAELLDLRNEVQTLRTLMTSIIDEQIKIEEKQAQVLEKQRQELAKEEEEAQKAAELERAAQEAKRLEEETLRKIAEQEEKERLAAEERQKEMQRIEEENNRRLEEERLRKLEEQRQSEEQAQEMKAAPELTNDTEEQESSETISLEDDHQAIARTIDEMTEAIGAKESHAERFKDTPTLGDRVSRSRLNDIKKAIGLNEKFLYANELFNGDMSAFTKAVEELNHVESERDAQRLMNEELSSRYRWDNEDETVLAFRTLVSRRFAS